MAARAGMTELISQLRGLTASGTADYSAGGVSWWTDDQLEDVLDRNRQDYYRRAVVPVTEYVAGSAIYKRYPLARNIEGTASGSAAWDLQDGNNNTVSGAYSLDAIAGVVTFTATTEGSTLYATYREYDINAAAADVWDSKAAYYMTSYDVESDNHKLKRSQLWQQASQMARHYRMQAKPQVVRMRRDDVYPG